MVDASEIKEHAKIIDAHGTHFGTVDKVVGDRIKLTKDDSADGKHHFISLGLVAEVEDGTVRLSADADNAMLLEESE